MLLRFSKRPVSQILSSPYLRLYIYHHSRIEYALTFKHSPRKQYQIQPIVRYSLDIINKILLLCYVDVFKQRGTPCPVYLIVSTSPLCYFNGWQWLLRRQFRWPFITMLRQVSLNLLPPFQLRQTWHLDLSPFHSV